MASTEEGARELGARYWAELARSTRGLVQVHERAGDLELVLGGIVTLFRFGPPETHVDGGHVECRFPIRGGLLTARAGGSLAIAQWSGAAPRLELSVIEYHPRLAPGRRLPIRGLLYSRLQAPLHRAVSRRFLTRTARGGS